MEKEKRYTWTVSVIALVDKDDEENGKIILDAWNEFEDSIKEVKNPNKDIKFVIYKYDLSEQQVYIIKSRKAGKKYVLEIIENHPLSVEDFYKPPYQHLIEFFDKHVAKKKIKKNEVHKHFLIVWGHAAGLGFMMSKIKKTIGSAFSFKDKDKSVFDKNIHSIAQKILEYNFLRSQLSIRNTNIPYQDFLSELLSNDDSSGFLEPDSNQKKAVEDVIRIITAGELKAILIDGLRNDNVSFYTTAGNNENPTKQKIQISLNLSCYVNMIETGFELKDIINVYIAPQTTIPFFGYHYRRLFELLSKKPSSDEKTIVINITNYYLSKYIESPVAEKVQDLFKIGEIHYKLDVSFSGTRLSQYDRIAGNINRFKQCVLMHLENDDRVAECPDKTITDLLKIARNKCISSIEVMGVIDYNHFVRSFFQLFNNPEDDNPENFNCENQIISDYFPGYLALSKYNINNEIYQTASPGAFSIFFPQKKSSSSTLEEQLLKLYFSNKGPNLFLSISEWDTILDKTYSI